MAPRIDSDCPTAPVKQPPSACERHCSIEKLPTLTPTTLEPACVSERGRAVLALSAIDAIKVTRHPTRDSFVVEVYTRNGNGNGNGNGVTSAASPTSGDEFSQHASHIPTRVRDHHTHVPLHKRFSVASDPAEDSGNPDTDAKRTPAVAFEKQLGDFSELRDALYNESLAAHSRVLLCKFCSEAIEYALWGHKVPAGLGARMLFHRDRELDKVAAVLSWFLSELLARTLSPPCVEHAAATAGGVPWCRAQSRVPVIVHAFLMQAETETQDE